MSANQRRQLPRSSDERNSAASGTPSPSESAQTAAAKDGVEDVEAGFAPSALACGDFPQPNPARMTMPAIAKGAQACIIRMVRLFGRRFIVLIIGERSLQMPAYYNRSATRVGQNVVCPSPFMRRTDYILSHL